MNRSTYIHMFPLAILSSILGCSSAPDSVPSKGSSAPSSPTATAPAAGQSQHVNALNTGVPGEQFASLDAGADSLSGVFVKDGVSLAFDVQHVKGASSFRLSTASGETLYSQVQGSTGIEMRVGSTYRSMLPVTPGAKPALQPTQTPAGFESSGDLKASFDALKATPFVLLPYLSAALGRVGLTGDKARIAMAVHTTAMQLTQALGLDMDREVRTATNQWISAAKTVHDGAAARPTVAGGLSGAETQGSTGEHTEALVITTPIACPASMAPPCTPPAFVSPSGLFAGCCITPAAPPPPRNYSQEWNCHYGFGREPLNTLTDDPCQDSCLGMCGPECTPWDWVCGDESVHTACWRHDSVPFPDWWDFTGWAVYGAYTSWIFTDTEALGMCENTWVTDIITDPGPWGLPTHHPGYYDYDSAN